MNQDLNVESIKHLEENIRENLWDFEGRQRFLRTQKKSTINEKKNEWNGFQNQYILCSLKDTFKKIKSQVTDREKIFINYIPETNYLTWNI